MRTGVGLLCWQIQSCAPARWGAGSLDPYVKVKFQGHTKITRTCVQTSNPAWFASAVQCACGCVLWFMIDVCVIDRYETLSTIVHLPQNLELAPDVLVQASRLTDSFTDMLLCLAEAY